MTRPLHDLNQDPHGITRHGTLGRDGVHEGDVDRAEDADAVEIALRLIEVFLPERVAAPYGQDTPHGARFHVVQPVDSDFADAHARARLRIELDFRFQNPCLGIEISQHLGVGVAAIAEPRHDRVGRRLHEKAIEGIADLQRQIAFQFVEVEDPVNTGDVEPDDADRIAFMDSECDVRITRCAPHHRIHHGVHIAALAIEQNQTDDIAPEFDFVEIALLAQS